MVVEGSVLISCPCPGAVEVVQDRGFHLDLEDYLAGVLIMASELVSPFSASFGRLEHDGKLKGFNVNAVRSSPGWRSTA